MGFIDMGALNVNTRRLCVLVLTAFAIPALAFAQTATTFSAGTTISSSGVNTAFGTKQDYLGTTGTGVIVRATSPALMTPNLGTPSAVVLTNATGLPVSTGISGLGTGISGALAVNVGSAGAPVVNGGAGGTPSSLTLTNATGLPLATGVTGTLQAAQEPAHTGDVTNSAGSLALTLATVNSGPGSVGSSTAIPVLTTNGKGLVTAQTTAPVVAPAGTLTGSTLASGVTASSLTSLGTLTTANVAGTLAVGTSGSPVTGPVNANAISVTDNAWITGTRGSFPQNPQGVAFNVQMIAGTGGGTGLNGADVVGTQSYVNYGTVMTDIGDRIGSSGGCLQTVSDTNGGCYGENNWVFVSGSGVVTHAVGTENDIAVQGASAPTYRTAFRAVGEGSYAGTTTDGALQIGASNTTANWGSLVSFSGFWGAQPIHSSGDFFDQSSDLSTWTVANIFNLPQLTISGNIFNFPNVILSGAGVATIASQGSSPSSPSSNFMRLWNDGFEWVGKNSAGSVVTMVPASGTAWTPADVSGASLTFTSVSANYVTMGNMVTAYATLTYPTTADGSTAKISLPVAVPNNQYAGVGAVLINSAGASGLTIRAVPNTSNTGIWNNSSGAYVTNATMSGMTVTFILTYPKT